MGKVILLLASPFCMIYEGLVIRILWGWFITAAVGITAPSVAICMGLSLIVAYFKTSPNIEGLDEKEALFKILDTLLRVSVFLGIGFLIHLGC